MVSAKDLINSPSVRRKRKVRAVKDKAWKYSIITGGLAVIGAILLIFFYLFAEAFPLFKSAAVDKGFSTAVSAPADQRNLYLTIEEQNEVALRIDSQGTLAFFAVDSSAESPTFEALFSQTVFDQAQRLPATQALTLDAAITETAITEADPAVTAEPVAVVERAPRALVAVAPFATDANQLALFAKDGAVTFVEHKYRSVYPDGVSGERIIEPQINRLADGQWFNLTAQTIEKATVRGGEDAVLAVYATEQGVYSRSIAREEDFLTEEVVYDMASERQLSQARDVVAIGVDKNQRYVFIAREAGVIEVVDARSAQRVDEYALADNKKITAAVMLLGDVSLLVGDDSGRVTQLFMTNAQGDSGNDGRVLTDIRTFDTGESVSHIIPEIRRKSFYVVGAEGLVSSFNTTSHKQVISERLFHADAVADLTGVISPRGTALLALSSTTAENAGEESTAHLFHVKNDHPDVSWGALWKKVWYEGYDEPLYIWQSSAATNDYEPKYSLVPLTFGTLKAAFYAMLFAIPLALCGAIFTGYFMAPKLRQTVKPTIELMQALPTVILGFLAGLVFAPLIDKHLAGVLSIFILAPVCIVLIALIWSRLPERVRNSVPDGWEPVLLVPVVVLAVMVPWHFSALIEHLFFGGNIQEQLNAWGYDYKARNSLVVGVAMGFAAIPIIFSIAEDAIFAVPKSLTSGSLALGGSLWQTMIRVILPTASPGIFSAIMIGFGRAVGETMIVLMATGNTPIMDASIFNGFRTLSANIAVEMPESEVGSSHFRILFLTALVLLIFTFVLNTTAEIVRNRLRKKYGAG